MKDASLGNLAQDRRLILEGLTESVSTAWSSVSCED